MPQRTGDICPCICVNVSSTLRNSQKVKTTWTSINWWADNQIMVYSYLSIKRNKVLIHDITWRNCKNSLLSERNPDTKGHKCNVCFHSYEVFRIGKSIQIEHGLVVAWGFLLVVGWGWELEGIFESVGNVLRLDSDKGPSSQSYGFSSSHVWIWELDYKAECWRIDAFELWCWRRLLGVPWTARSSNQSILKEISPKYSLEGLMLKLKLQYFWPLDAKNWLIWKDPDAGKDWRQEEKGNTEDEMVGWHHWLDGHEFEQALGVGDGQGSLACCSPWGHKELDMTERLNWSES